MAMYESDHTKFMREWMAKHPEQRDEQKQGRALWWDKPQRVDEQQRIDAAEVVDKGFEALLDPSGKHLKIVVRT